MIWKLEQRNRCQLRTICTYECSNGAQNGHSMAVRTQNRMVHLLQIIGANFRTFSGLLGLSRAWKIADNGMQCFKMITKSPCGPSNCTRMPKQQIVSKLYVVVCAGWMIDFEKLDSSCDCALGTANTTQSAHGVSKLYVKMISYVCGARARGNVCQDTMIWNPKFRLCFKIDARSEALQLDKREK